MLESCNHHNWLVALLMLMVESNILSLFLATDCLNWNWKLVSLVTWSNLIYKHLSRCCWRNVGTNKKQEKEGPSSGTSLGTDTPIKQETAVRIRLSVRRFFDRVSLFLFFSSNETEDKQEICTIAPARTCLADQIDKLGTWKLTCIDTRNVAWCLTESI